MSEANTQALEAQARDGELFGAILPLLEVSEKLLSEVEIERLYQLILEIVQRETGADIVSLMLLDAENRELSVEAAVGLPAEVAASAKVKPGEGVAGWVIEHGQPLLLAEDAPVDPTIREAMQRDDVSSALCVPLKTQGRVIGVVNASRLPRNPLSTSWICNS